MNKTHTVARGQELEEMLFDDIMSLVKQHGLREIAKNAVSNTTKKYKLIHRRIITQETEKELDF